MSRGIFISYRRADASGHAGRLFDRLAAHFGKDAVFMDVEGIEAGVDFVDVIGEAVGSCAVLLAVMGRNWLTSADERGRRRLEDPQDFIRLEIGNALARKVRVVPVLVEGAQMPAAEQLPEELRPLTRRQALELRDSRWDSDVEALIAVIERILAQAPREDASASADISRQETRVAPTGTPPVGHMGPRKRWIGITVVGLGLLAVVIAATGLLWSLGKGSEERASHESGLRHQALDVQSSPADSPASVTPLPREQPLAAGNRPSAAQKPPTSMPRQNQQVVSDNRPGPGPKPAPGDPGGSGAGYTPALPADPPIADHVAKPDPPVAAAQTHPPPVLGGTGNPPQAVVTQPPGRMIAVLARGEPTRRDFWEGEASQAYSQKMVHLFATVLQDHTGVTIVATRPEGEWLGSLLDGAAAQRRRACESTGAQIVYVALARESFAISPTDSAYWPELRLGLIACHRDSLKVTRHNLSPRRGDDFPFAREMGEAMQSFVRDTRHLLSQ